MIRQVSEPCPTCGSWYRNGDICNICGGQAPVKEESADLFVSHSSQGRQWSKKEHRYLTHKEVAEGKKGG